MKTYIPSDVVVQIGGAILSGYADGTFVRAARNGPGYSQVTGGDGDTSRTKLSDLSGTIVVTLKQTSNSNAILGGLAILGTVMPAMVKDVNGNTVIAAAEAWVLQPSDAEFATEETDREWTIQCAELEFLFGVYTED